MDQSSCRRNCLEAAKLVPCLEDETIIHSAMVGWCYGNVGPGFEILRWLGLGLESSKMQRYHPSVEHS